jgi:hypothetical protein
MFHILHRVGIDAKPDKVPDVQGRQKRQRVRSELAGPMTSPAP